MASQNNDSLEYLLRPEILTDALSIYWPWSKAAPVDWEKVKNLHFGNTGIDADKMRRVCYPALKKISVIGLESMPDLMKFLPLPSAPEFSQQALGLVILLDQGPRYLLKEHDARWTSDYFDHIVYAFVSRLLALPAELRPDTAQRWTDAGYSIDSWAAIRFWFIAPFAHAEIWASQERAMALTDEVRVVVERRTATVDPYRSKRDQNLRDPLAFSRLLSAGPPAGSPKLTMPEWIYWFALVIDVHSPIIAKFGRYPYRNGAFGRITMAEEEEFLKDTNCFGCIDPESAAKIRKDVLAGRWTPLK
ncbi:hypothetical protein B0H16DRAFT_1525618 [Mycena metata]|uniref:Uncharacterized protein n=1 Tax=Mycena metata TaxID=1033252 RepID=A0AAD7NKF6_9AGAR|nr:hypothetical protein B0H16DRAFT_1525618 [Mycena metata]